MFNKSGNSEHSCLIHVVKWNAFSVSAAPFSSSPVFPSIRVSKAEIRVMRSQSKKGSCSQMLAEARGRFSLKASGGGEALLIPRHGPAMLSSNFWPPAL